MARMIRHPALATRTAREALKPRKAPYWFPLDQGCALGYYRGMTGGAWWARCRDAEGNYASEKIALADDREDADGHAILGFYQAQTKARDWIAQQVRMRRGGGEAGPFTVAKACDEYLASFGDHRPASREHVEAVIEAHIRPKLGAIKCSELSSPRIRQWHEQVARTPARKRSKAGAPVAYFDAPTDAEGMRKRRVTANNILTVLKAILNAAWRNERIANDDAWRRVRAFRNVNQPRIRHLTAAEARRLVNATDEQFRPMVNAALLTGCRYGELRTLRVSDYDPERQTIYVRMSKSGKPRHVPLTEEANRFFQHVTLGKAADAHPLHKRNGSPWGKSEPSRYMARACLAASIEPAIGFHILRHTFASLALMHGVSLEIIAKTLGHADTRITERHYAHLAPSYVHEVIRAKMPALGTVEHSNVVAL